MWDLGITAPTRPIWDAFLWSLDVARLKLINYSLCIFINSILIKIYFH